MAPLRSKLKLSRARGVIRVGMRTERRKEGSEKAASLIRLITRRDEKGGRTSRRSDSGLISTAARDGHTQKPRLKTECAKEGDMRCDSNERKIV